MDAEVNEEGEVDDITNDPEYRKELDRRITKFRELRVKLEQALGDQRATYFRYINRENRTPKDRKLFFEQRDRVRLLLDETFDAALDVSRIGFDKEAVTFTITMIQHRHKQNIYDTGSMEGAARMIDGGSQLKFLFETAIRSSIVEGEFAMAKQLLDALQDEELGEIEASLRFHLDQHEKNFKREKQLRDQESAEDRLPRVKLNTTQGDVVLELFIDQAPGTVSHFIQLVEDGFYDEMDFHLVIDNKLALTGDPSGTGTGNSGKFLQDEHSREDARDGFRGSVVMAKIPMGDTGKFIDNSGSSQFAILLLPITSVSESQTVFGRVVEGMDAISRLRRVDPNKKKKKNEIVQPPDAIIEATVIRKPDQMPEPVYIDPRKQPVQSSGG